METVLITGASRGIGLELSRQYAVRGDKVVATFRGTPSAALQSIANESNLVMCELEVTDADSIATLAETLANETLDIVINNAGIIGPERQNFKTINADEWLATFAVNTIAPFMLSRALLDNLRHADNPRLITVSSSMGALNEPGVGMYAYRSSKAALNKVMQLLAVELNRFEITVCPIDPGWVKTDMGGPQAALAVEESVAGIIKVISSLSFSDSGKFFTWEGEVRTW